MSTKIYTRTGDKGKTSLIGGTKVPKNHIRIETYGTIDELNSYIGLVSDYQQNQQIIQQLREIQDRLFTIGSSLACDPDKETKLKIPDLKDTDVTFLEQSIDQMNEALPPMRSFLLPGGEVSVSVCHIARCVCRRAERLCVNMQEQNMFVPPLIIQYLNRLSDYLFVLARYTALEKKIAETPWKPRV
jgi:cob(I)alamin adenosyltransferase